MKKSTFLTALAVGVLVTVTFSCEELSNALGLGDRPALETDEVSIKSLDMEKITFNCDYSVTNPYPVAFSVASITANFAYEGDEDDAAPLSFNVATDGGFSVAERNKTPNTLNFAIPYDTILNFVRTASTLAGKTSLPFTLSGNITLDLSTIEAESLSNIISVLSPDKTMTIPFAKSFQMPVFKPNLSIDTSSVTWKKPSSTEIITALIGSGISLLEAGTIATSIASGNVTEAVTSVLARTDLNVGLNFNLGVSKEGSAAWKYLIDTCGLKTTEGTLLANVAPANNNVIESDATVPMAATISAAKAASYVIKLIAGTAENPSFELSSALSFPELEQYGIGLPLSYQKELPIR